GRRPRPTRSSATAAGARPRHAAESRCAARRRSSRGSPAWEVRLRSGAPCVARVLLGPRFGHRLLAPAERPLDLPTRVGPSRPDEPDQHTDDAEQQSGSQAGPFAVSLAIGQPRRDDRRAEPGERQVQGLRTYRSEDEGHAPRYAFWTSGFSRSADALSERAIVPVSSTYARSETSSAKLAFCSTSKIVVPCSFISATV